MRALPLRLLGQFARLACGALPALGLHAQEQLRVQGPTPAVVVLGGTARVDLVIEGRSADPKPFEVPQVDGLAIRVTPASRQVHSSIDHRGRVDQVFVNYSLVVEPQREGQFTIPSFRINTGTTVQTVPPLELRAVKQLRGAELGYLDVRLEKTRVYVHEPVRARVEFGVDPGLDLIQGVHNGTRYLDVEVKAPWLGELEGAIPIEEPEVKGDRVPVVLNRTLAFAAYSPGHVREGRSFRSFVLHRSFLPTRPGVRELDAPLLRYHVQLTQGRQGLFGERIGGQSENYYVYGEPLRLEVLPIPERGRPVPYYGAVGRFAVDASLDRDSVKVGGSVKLELAIRGDGNFEFLRVPELDDLERKGWHRLGKTERRDAGSMTVTYDLTPLSADVQQVPGIAWNWFDTTPGVETFRTVTTDPLPIRVVPLSDAETLESLPTARRGAVTPGVDDIFDLPSFAGPPVRVDPPSPAVRFLAVFGPWLAAALAAAFVAVRRRRRADPAAVRARAAARTCERALQAGAEPAQALAQYLGDRLGLPAAATIDRDLARRLQEAGFDAALAGELAGALEGGIAARYGGGTPLDAARVRELVRRCEQEPLRPLVRRAPLALLCAAVLAATAPRAQDAAPRGAEAPPPANAPGTTAPSGNTPRAAPAASGDPVEDAVRAYRDGDYAAAEALFGKALLVRDDRRLWFARGNCLYRLGDLPRAIWAWECARLGMPRDDELLANLALARRKLDLDASAETFGDALLALRERLTAGELAALGAAAMAVAAFALLLGRRRAAWRWVGGIAAIPALWCALELLWLGPARPPRAIALRDAAVVAEPRPGLPAVADVRRGATLALRGGTDAAYARVEAGERSGYVESASIAVVR